MDYKDTYFPKIGAWRSKILIVKIVFNYHFVKFQVSLPAHTSSF